MTENDNVLFNRICPEILLLGHYFLEHSNQLSDNCHSDITSLYDVYKLTVA